jgi:hypothetical protein
MRPRPTAHRLHGSDTIYRSLESADRKHREKRTEMLAQDSYLLQNQLNPFPISGKLTLGDDGRLTFALDEKAAGASLGWLEKALGADDLKDRINAGERPVAFELSVAGRKFAWPKTLGGYAMKFEEDDGRKWIVSLNYPSGGGVWQAINMINSGKTAKPWKQALAAAGGA